jgi:hypothetical protein
MPAVQYGFLIRSGTQSAGESVVSAALMHMRRSRRATRDEVPVSAAQGNPQKNMLLPRTVTQPLETVTAPQTLTISNIGSMPLAISGLTFVGSDPGNFFVGSDLRRAPDRSRTPKTAVKSPPALRLRGRLRARRAAA